MQYTTASLIQVLDALPAEKREAYIREFLEEVLGEAKWEQLLATPESDKALEDMGHQALEDHQAGRTQSLSSFLRRNRDQD